MMKEDSTAALSRFSPDLFVSPHVLPLLMELFIGERQQVIAQQEQLLAHLNICHYCRTAVVVLLGLASEYDLRNNDSQEPALDLLTRFADISREIEAYEARMYECLGAYAEYLAEEGQDKARLRFPDIAAHLEICPDCHTAVEATVSFIAEETIDL